MLVRNKQRTLFIAQFFVFFAIDSPLKPKEFAQQIADLYAQATGEQLEVFDITGLLRERSSPRKTGEDWGIANKGQYSSPIFVLQDSQDHNAYLGDTPRVRYDLMNYGEHPRRTDELVAKLREISKI